ncbi:hypothetical protein CEXT_534891 [Caerostris extrusa]|uniref:Uncharacterized protein n=1 Tax=Caerostris extrusa TaxID=172846 RepID=A0AAV4XQH0_CAEEX|nr:hypothetical protein CEXT_534891 [Caerostris extrusa]
MPVCEVVEDCFEKQPRYCSHSSLVKATFPQTEDSHARHAIIDDSNSRLQMRHVYLKCGRTLRLKSELKPVPKHRVVKTVDRPSRTKRKGGAGREGEVPFQLSLDSG